jgi:hypothetical protein
MRKKSETVESAIPSALNKLPAGKLLYTWELAQSLGCSKEAVLRVVNPLAAHTVTVKRKRLWGSVKTIREAEATLVSHR